MIFNNGYPASYQPFGYNYQQYQQPMQNQPQQQQMMTPPTIRAEIVQVDSEEAASNYPVGPGSSQMMIAKDDSAIFVKTAMANGQSSLDVFVKRPRTPSKHVFDPDKYVTRDELENRLQAILGGYNVPHSNEIKEGEQNEPV